MMKNAVSTAASATGRPMVTPLSGPSSDRRLVVPAVTIWVGMWVITGWSWGWMVVLGVLLVGCAGLVLLWRRRRGRGDSRLVLQVAAVLVVLLSCLVDGGLRVTSLKQGLVAQAAGEQRVAQVEVVVKTARLSATWGMAVVEADLRLIRLQAQSYQLNQPVTVMVPSQYASQWLSYPAGSRIAVSVRLSVADQEAATAAVLSPLADAQVIRPPPLWQRIIESMRSGLVAAMVHNSVEQAGLVPALVVGDTTTMPTATVDDFRTTGLTHLTAVSGANLAILLSFLTAVARWIGVRGHGLTMVSLVGVVVFVALCHSEPSVLRAAAMGLVALAAVGRGSGQSGGLRALSLAVLGLCWIDPWIARSWGFILSVLACLGIIWWGRRWSLILRRWLPEWMAEAMAIPLAAQVATQPVVCWLSGAISVSGLMANAAAGVWVAPATVIGLVAALVSPLSGVLAIGAGYVAGWCAQPILLIGHGFASLPGASHQWPTTLMGMAVVVVGCAVVAWVIPFLLDRVWLVLLVSAALVVAMLSAPVQPGWPGTAWRVAACDVGQGDALVVSVSPGEVILLDAGPEGAAVTTCLRQLGVSRIYSLILTHFHSDHAEAVAAVLDSFPVDSILGPRGGGDRSSVEQAARRHGLGVSQGQVGTTGQWGDVTVTVVSAYQGLSGASDGEESSLENDESLVIRVDTPQMSLLDTGDIELSGQQAALQDPTQLVVDIVKVPHHGSSRQDAAFLAATQAKIALISVGEDNTYGHPTQRTLTELVNQGMEVVRTDEHGSITITHTDTWSITTQQ